MIEIYAVGGYDEVGKNCTMIRVDDEAIIIDMGLHLPNYITYTEEEGEDIRKFTRKELMKVGAIPDDRKIVSYKNIIKAIIPTHGHLDHIGAIPYLANQYDCPIYGTPFTCAVIRRILKDEKIHLKNQINVGNINSTHRISEKIKIQFISATHSIPHASMIAVHTPYGTILYTNDFKFDKTPTIGHKPNYEALEQLGEKGVLAVIVDALYSDADTKTPSESVAKEMLKEIMLGVNSKDKAVIVTTFSSHIARLKSIVEFGKQMNRKILFLGRSLSRYAKAAADVGLYNFEKEVEIVGGGKRVKAALEKMSKRKRDAFLLVTTGHQGEPKAVLSKMANKLLPFEFQKEDHVIFSCKIIPTDINKEYRDKLETQLKSHGVRIFKEVHVSGHAAREDLRDLINMIKPVHIIPAHATTHQSSALVDLAHEMGYSDKFIHHLKNGQKLSF